MATKEQVTEYVDGQEDELSSEEWNTTTSYDGTRISMIQNWMSPEIAGILQKLVGDAIMVARISKNRSNV